MGIWINENFKKQYWENGRALRNLSYDSPIIFEKYAEKYINNKKNQK